MNSRPSTMVIEGVDSRFEMEMLYRQFPEAEGYWDGNWIVTRFQANRSWFEVDFINILHLGDLVWLRNELAKMHSASAGLIEWEPLDGFLKLVAAPDESGNVRWVIEMLYDDAEELRTSIEINNDSTALLDILRQIDDVLGAFPLRGRQARRTADPHTKARDRTKVDRGIL